MFLSNMSAIEERLKKAAKEKEKIMSQKWQDYAQSQANNLHKFIAQLLQDLEEEKKRVKNADISAIKEQIKAYQNLSGNIEMKFREAYEEFILHFINNIRAGLEETLKKAIQTAKMRSREEEEEEHYIERVKQGGLGGWARWFGSVFNSDDKSKESLLFLSNMSAIEERLKKAAKEKEKIMSQKWQDYAQSQANNLHKFIAQLLQDLEEEKKRVKNADISAIKEQIKAYQNLSGNIEMKFREAYEEFILHFINNIRAGLEETLKKAIQTAKMRSREEEEEEHYIERVKQGGLGGWARWFGSVVGEKDWGYDEVERTRATIKAGAVLDYLTEMHESCQGALNDSANSFKVVFRKELYAKVFKQLREIIPDDLIDKVAFKKSVMAVLDRIEFKEFDYNDKLPSEMRGKTGNLKGDEANAFIQSVEMHVRDFKAEVKQDVKGYIQGLRETLEEQNFASDTLQKLQENMQNLQNQVQNKVQSIAQLDAKIQALKGIQ
ncbi:hypothetical protein JT217_02145 [Helicobacter pylori]|nr:hypothetical protein [Helicobacter pylori]